MVGDKDYWNVEIRVHYENGDGEDDYTEEDYQFDSKSEAMAFAKKRSGNVHDVLYYQNGREPRSFW